MRLYLDACAIIYAIEGTATLRDAVLKRIAQVESVSEGMLITSRLSRLECRVKPLRQSDSDLLTRYEGFFNRTTIGMIHISTSVIERATTLRAVHNLKTADAIHLATALKQHADLFLTGDTALARSPGIKFELV